MSDYLKVDPGKGMGENGNHSQLNNEPNSRRIFVGLGMAATALGALSMIWSLNELGQVNNDYWQRTGQLTIASAVADAKDDVSSMIAAEIEIKQEAEYRTDIATSLGCLVAASASVMVAGAATMHYAEKSNKGNI